MKLKNSYILLIVMAIFLLVSMGSVCANDNVSDTALADDGSSVVLANGTGDAPEPKETEIISADNVEIDKNDPTTNKIDLTVNDKNSSSKINITNKNLTIKENNKTLKFDYANNSITINDTLTKGNHSLLIEYLGNLDYAKSNKTIFLTIFGNYTIDTPDSINVNSTKIVKIPVNVTNGKDSKTITANDFRITLSYKENNTNKTINIEGLRYDNGNLIFNYTLANQITSSTMTIVYNGTEETLSKSLKLNRIYNAKIEVINAVNEYREGNFTFKLIDIDTNSTLGNKTLQFSIPNKYNSRIATTITTDSNGIVTINNNAIYYLDDNNRLSETLPVGKHTIEIETSSPIKCPTFRTNLTIEKAKVDITIDKLDEYYGTTKNIKFTVKNSKSKNLVSEVPIYFKITDKNGKEVVYLNNGVKFDSYITNTNGTIELLSVKNLIAGTYTVYASLNSTDNYVGNSVSKNITIKAIPIKYEITSGTMDYNTGNTATIKVIDARNNKNNPVEGAIVIVQFDNDKNQVYGYISDAKGVVNVMVPLNVGNHKMIVMDANDGRFTASPVPKTFTVKKATAKISAPKVSAYYKQGKYLTIKLINTKKNKPIYYAKVNVRVYVSSTKYYNYHATTGSDGKVKLAINLKPGKYKVEVRGAESKNYAAKKVTTKITVKKAPTKLTAKKLTAKKGAKKYFKVTAKNKKTKKPIAGIKLKIKVYTGKKFKTYKVKTNKNGIAKLSVKSLKVGKHKVVVTSANKYCVAKAAKSTIKIKK